MKDSFLNKLLSRIDRVDVDELQNHLQELLREKGFLETIFNALLEGIIVTDKEGNIRYLNHNAQVLLGIPTNEAVGKSVRHYLRGLKWKDLFTEGKVISREVEVSYPETRYLNFYLVPLESSDEANQGGSILIFHDSTLTRERTQETIEAERLTALTDLAAGVAHELGNPLNSISIQIQLLERQIQKKEKPSIDKSLNALKTEVKRLDMIVSDFLGAVRHSPAKHSPDSLNQVIEDALHFMHSEIEGREINIEMKLSSRIPLLLLDRDQIRQAFFNIIKNAIQAMDEGGSLRIKTECDEIYASILFEDTGSGISSEDLPHLFKPYFTTKTKGSGLGLLIVQRIIREHGGKVEVTSNEEKGTAIRVLFPLVKKNLKMLPEKS